MKKYNEIKIICEMLLAKIEYIVFLILDDVSKMKKKVFDLQKSEVQAYTPTYPTKNYYFKFILFL